MDDFEKSRARGSAGTNREPNPLEKAVTDETGELNPEKVHAVFSQMLARAAPDKKRLLKQLGKTAEGRLRLVQTYIEKNYNVGE